MPGSEWAPSPGTSKKLSGSACASPPCDADFGEDAPQLEAGRDYYDDVPQGTALPSSCKAFDAYFDTSKKTLYLSNRSSGRRCAGWRGRVVPRRPRPAPRRAELYAELRAPFQRARGGPGGWWLIPDVDVAFGAHDVLRPDIPGWRRERVPEFPTARPVRHRPDWICEGLSPATAARDQSEKRSIYQRAGVPWFWQLDPTNRTLSVLRLTAEGYVVEGVVGEREAARLPPFDAMALDIRALFPPAPSSA